MLGYLTLPIPTPFYLKSVGLCNANIIFDRRVSEAYAPDIFAADLCLVNVAGVTQVGGEKHKHKKKKQTNKQQNFITFF